MSNVVTSTPNWVEIYPRCMPTNWSLTLLPREEWPASLECSECGDELDARTLAADDPSLEVTCPGCQAALRVAVEPKRITQADGSYRWERSVALEVDRR